MEEPKPDKLQRQKRSHGGLWILIVTILTTILAFAVLALLILKKQGIAQGTTTLTPISIVIGIAISLLTLLFTFLQWFYPRHSSEHGNTIVSPNPSPLISPLIAQVFPSASQSVALGIAEDSSISTNKIIQHSELSIREKAPTENTSHGSLHEDWGESPHLNQFYGREKELAELQYWILADHCRILAVLGIGGIGKTALAAKIIDQVKNDFEYVFWRSLKNVLPLELVLKNCIQFLSNQQQIDLPENTDDQITLLIKYMRDHRCLFGLDNLESVMQSGNPTGQFRKGYE